MALTFNLAYIWHCSDRETMILAKWIIFTWQKQYHVIWMEFLSSYFINFRKKYYIVPYNGICWVNGAQICKIIQISVEHPCKRNICVICSVKIMNHHVDYSCSKNGVCIVWFDSIRITLFKQHARLDEPCLRMFVTRGHDFSTKIHAFRI